MDKGARFYESVLRKNENGDDIKVVNVRVCQACGKGENFVSNVQRVFIEGYKNSQPYNASMIAKIRSKSLLAQKFHFDEAFQNEVDAYKHILPELRRHSKSKLFLPDSLYINGDLIILEDLSSLGYKSYKKGHRFSLDESLIVLKELAKLHAASLSLQERKPAHVQELKKLVNEIYQIDRNEELEGALRTQIKLAGLIFERDERAEDQSNQRVIAQLKTIENSGYRRICDAFLSERKLSVFNQGDSWGNNILFGNNSVCFVDFQMMRFTSVAADLSYFLYINLLPRERRANFDELLTGYLEELRTRCEENGVGEELTTELTMDWLKSEMKDFALFGFLSAIFIQPVFYFTSENLDVDGETDYGDFKLMTEEHKNVVREYVLDFLADDIGARNK